MQSVVAVLENKLVLEAWRISFRTAVRPGEVPLVAAHEPRYIAAFAEPLAPDAALEPEGEDDGSLRILWIPSGTRSTTELENASIKIAVPIDRTNGDPRIVRAGLRTISVVWSQRRVVICSAREQLDEALDAVVRFTLAERETVDLERQMADTWPILKGHTPLTHTDARRRYRRYRPEVARMTEQVTQMRATLLRLQTALEQLDPALASTSKRLYAELVLQAGIYERLEMLEDPIEFAMERYELANTRMLDARTASNELWMEAAILAALIVEVIVMLELVRFV
jgi:hypothetical protein